MQRFYWLLDGNLAGCSRPGEQLSSRGQDSRRNLDVWEGPSEALAADLVWLKQQGIGAVLSLTETPLEAEILARHGMEVLHLPVPDMTAPFPEQFMEALHFIDLQRSAGQAVAVHCLMGQGRTGAILAAYLIRSGMSAEDAVTRLRTICPGAIGSPEQEAALRAFAARQDWIL